MSGVGKVCENHVENESTCQESASLLKDRQYVKAKGVGADLPFGCISDKTDVDNHLVYWNPNGVAVSNDPLVRQICLQKEDPLKGMLTRFVI